MNANRLLLGLLVLTSCVRQMEDDVRQQLMDEALQSRIERFRQQKSEDCRDEVISEALWKVDSVFRTNPILVKLDSIDRPPLPAKPARPELIKPPANLSLEPLIQEEERDTTASQEGNE